MICIVVGIELLQFITISGCCDIDDVILNVLGSLIMFVILRISSINKFLRNIVLLEKNKIDYKDLIKKIIIILIPIICIIGVVFISENKYIDKNSQTFTNLKIIDKTKEENITCKRLFSSPRLSYHSLLGLLSNCSFSPSMKLGRQYLYAVSRIKAISSPVYSTKPSLLYIFKARAWARIPLACRYSKSAKLSRASPICRFFLQIPVYMPNSLKFNLFISLFFKSKTMYQVP